MKALKWLLVPVLLGSLAGCGGSGTQVLGRNSLIELVILAASSGGIRDFDLVVAPQRGDIDHPDACTIVDRSFCDETSKSVSRREIRYRFKTRSTASSKPYYVWAENLASDEWIDYRLQVYVDGELKYDKTRDLAPGEIGRLLSVSRNSVSD